MKSFKSVSWVVLVIAGVLSLSAACGVKSEGLDEVTESTETTIDAAAAEDTRPARKDTAAPPAPGVDAPKAPGKIGDACAVEADCDTRTCVDKVCRAKPENPGGRAQGAACDKSDQCKSAFCVDGLCCDTACAETCRSCTTKDKPGVCTNIAAGAAPRVPAMCPDERAACGTTGVCDGAGQCGRVATGASCGTAAAMCTAPGELTASRCVAPGMCAVSKAACANGFACDKGACLTKCTDDKQCIAGEKCHKASGYCTPAGALVIPYRKAGPVIDGAKGLEDAWAAVEDIYYVRKQIIPQSAVLRSEIDPDVSASFRVMWNEEGVFVWVGVQDDSKIRNSDKRVWHDDCVEVYFDADYSRGMTYDGKNDFQYLLPYTEDPTKAVPFEQSSETRPEVLKDVAFATTNDTFGYFLEAKFPWSTLGRAPVPGMRIGFDLQVDDDDQQNGTNGADRDEKISWWGAVEEAFRNPSFFGTAVLGPKP